jgi:glycosyltransferase involved in cell wall biosynthesis
LAERGIETDVVTTDDNGPQRLKVPLGIGVQELGVTYRYFPRQTRLYTFSLPMAWWLWKNAGNYDLIHIHAVFTYASTIAAWVARIKGIPYVIRPLGILNSWGLRNRRQFPKKMSLWAIERSMFAHAALVHYTSDQERIEAEEAGVRSPSVTIANPVDLESLDRACHVGKFRAGYPALEDRRLVVLLSRIARKKGIDLLISAFATVNRQIPDTVLVIAGDGEENLIEQLKDQVREAGLCNSVIWPGFLNGDGKAALLADAEVFVLPSHSENFGVAVVEALCFQVPVIVSDQVGIHREISQHQAGLVVPCEPQALTNALLEVLSKPELRSELAANAATLAHRAFSRGTILDALLAAYHLALHPLHP